LIATIIDNHERGAFKRSAIQAELAAAIQPKREKGKRNEGSRDNGSKE
jgi:hypothetical protein